MYFELFKLRNWRKRSAEVRRHNCAVLPKISDILKRTDCDRRESPEGATSAAGLLAMTYIFRSYSKMSLLQLNSAVSKVATT